MYQARHSIISIISIVRMNRGFPGVKYAVEIVLCIAATGQSSASAGNSTESPRGMLIVRYRLHPAVFYRRQGPVTSLHHTATRKVYSLGGSAADVLDQFVEYRSEEEAAETLRAAFTISDDTSFRTGLHSFVEQMAADSILRPSYVHAGPRSDLERDEASRATQQGRLSSATLELTYRCNEKCRHCFIVDDHRAELTTSQVCSVLDELAEFGVQDLTFTGGEIFMRKDIFAILAHAQERRFVVDIFTNGVLLTPEKILRLKATWPRCVHFSLYSNAPSRHDAITQVKGSFERTLKAAKNCALIGIPINIKAPILTETVSDVAALSALAEELGASIELGRSIIPRKDGNTEGIKLKIRSQNGYDVLSEELEKALGAPEHNGSMRADGGRLCGAGDHSLCITPNGYVTPCNSFPLVVGTVRESTVREIWESSPQLTWWRSHNQRSARLGCESCPDVDPCIYCPGEAMIRAGDPLLRYDEACADTRLALHHASSTERR